MAKKTLKERLSTPEQTLIDGNTGTGARQGSYGGTGFSINEDQAIEDGLQSLDMDDPVFQQALLKGEGPTPEEEIQYQQEKAARKAKKEEELDKMIYQSTPTSVIEEEFQKDLTPEQFGTMKELKLEKQLLLREEMPYSFKYSERAREVAERDAGWDVTEMAANAIRGITLNIASAVTPTTAGMSEEKAARYNDIEDQIYSLQRNSLRKQKTELDVRIGKLSEQIDYSNTFNPLSEDSKKHAALNILKDMENDFDIRLGEGDATENSYKWMQKFNATDLSFGWGDLAKDILVYQPVYNKMHNGEPLKGADTILAEALKYRDDVQSSGELNPTNYYTKMGTGFVDSAKFMGQMYASGGAGNVAAKKLGTKLLKKGAHKYAARGAAALANAGVRSTIMPGTVSTSLEKYNGLIQSVENPDGTVDYLTRDKVYDKMIADTEVWKADDRNRSQELYKKQVDSKISPEEQLELERIEYRLGMSTNNPSGDISYKNLVESVKPMDAVTAARHGYFSSFNEVLSETVGGKILGKMLPKISVKNPMGNNAFYKKSLAKTAGLREKVALGSVREEYLEELFVAPLNALNDGSTRELDMLLTPQYHMEILGQVMSTGGLMRLPGVPAAMINRKKKKERYKDIAESKEAFKTVVEEVGRNVNFPEFADYIDLRSNTDIIRVDDFQTAIKKLKNEGKTKEADELRDKMLTNMAKVAVGTNTEKTFINNLQNMALKADVEDIEMQKSLAKASALIKEVKETKDKFREAPNYEDVVDAKAVATIARQEVEKAEVIVKDLQDKAKVAIDNAIKGTEFEDVDFDYSDLFGKEKNVELLDFLEKKQINIVEDLFQAEVTKGQIEDVHKSLEDNFEKLTSNETQETLKVNQVQALEFSKKFEAKVKEEGVENVSLSRLRELADETGGQISPDIKANIVEQVYFSTIKKREEESKAAQEAISKENEKEQVSSPQGESVTRDPASKVALEMSDPEASVPPETHPSLDSKEGTAILNLTSLTEEVNSKTPKRTPIPPEQKETPDSEVASSDKGIVVEEQDLGFGDPTELDSLPTDDLKDSQKNIIKSQVAVFHEIAKNKEGKTPSFESIITHIAETYGTGVAEEMFNTIVLGWKLNNYTPTNYDKAYFSVFKDIENIEKNALLTLMETVGGTQKLKTQEEHQEEVKEVEEKVVEEVKETIAIDAEGNKVKVSTGRKVTDPNLRLGFNAVGYKETVSEKGEFTREDDSTELKESEFINYKELIHPDKNNVEDSLGVVMVPEEHWEKMQVSDPKYTNGRDAKGNYKTIAFKQWYDEKLAADPNFRETKEFKDKVPMFAMNSQGVPVAHIHDTDWYNPYNIGNPYEDSHTVDVNDISPSHQELMDRGKENHSTLRSQIVDGEVRSIKITAKKPGPGVRIPTDQAPISLSASNPQTIVTVQQGTKLMTKDGVTFNNSERVIINPDSTFNQLSTDSKYKTAGHTWALMHIDTVDGVKRYMAYPVLRRNEEGEDGVEREHLDTVRHAYAAHIILTDAKSDYKKIKDTEYEMSKEQALKVQADIKKETGFDIGNPNGSGMINFMKLYLVFRTPKGVAAKPYQLFNSEDLSDYTQHTNLKGLGANVKVPIIGKDHVVTPGVEYHEHLLNNLKTNVKGFDVSATDTPKYAVSLQPTINYEGVKSEQQEESPVVKMEKETVEKLKEVESQPEVKEKVDVEKTLEAVSSFLIEEGLTMESGWGDILDSLPEITTTDPLREALRTVDNFTPDQEEDIVNFIVASLLDSLSKKDTRTSKELKNDIKKQIAGAVKLKRDLINEHYRKLQEADEALNAPGLDPIEASEKAMVIGNMFTQLDNAVKKINSIGTNWKQFMSKAELKVYVSQGVELSETVEENEATNVKDFNKTSFEDIQKLKISKELKRVFSAIPELDSKGEPIKGFLGVSKFLEPDDVYNAMIQMITSDISVQSDYGDLVKRLELQQESHPWVGTVLERLDKGDLKLQKQFVYNFVRHGLKMKFAMYTSNKNGSPSLKVYDTNANEIKSFITKQWKNNYKTSKLIDRKGNVNPVAAEKALEELTNMKLREVSTEKLQSWLQNNFGITLADGVFEDLKNEKVVFKGRVLDYEAFLHGKDGLFYHLRDYLKAMSTKKEKLSLEDYKENDPFLKASQIIKILTDVEAKYQAQSISISFRDQQKSVSGIIAPSLITDTVGKLKRDVQEGGEFIKKMQKLSFSQQSTILDLLLNDPEFAHKFEVDHLGLTAIKELGKQAGMNAGITDLNIIDYALVALTGFQDMKQGEVKTKSKNGIGRRIARMFAPTMSDKSQMLQLTTGVLNLFEESDFVFEENMDFKDPLKEELFTQLVLPELTRIVNRMKKDTPTNIKGYDTAAHRFNILPELNNTTAKIEGKEMSILTYLQGKKDTNLENLSMDTVIEHFKDSLIEVVENNIKQQVEETLVDWDGSIRQGDNLNLDEAYLKQKEGLTVDQQTKLAAYDYVINSNLSYMDMFQVFAGDPAVYGKNKDFSENLADMTVEENIEASKKLGTNLGKRLALLIAPGIPLADSKDQKYNQIFLQDTDDIAQNAEYLVRAHYGSKAAREARKYIDKYNTANTQEVREDARKKLKADYPLIKDFFNVESTDAQEYSTIMEHLNVLESQGRISTEMSKRIVDKVLLGEDLTKAELGIVFQPIKPVYTGQILDPIQDVMRTMYIKTSSFPLLPQLTRGLQLDDLRVKMEEIEKETGKFVRASYQSGNKVGATIQTVNPLDPTSLAGVALGVNMLELDRENFRIQQDVPYKSDHKREDKISMGTQIFKLLFGDDLILEEDFQYKGKTIGGKELYKEFRESFTSLVDLKSKALYTELGMNPDGTMENEAFTMEALSNLLKKEGETRNFSQSDLDSLDIVPIKKPDGTIASYDFRVPLWLHSNSNKFEALLNSIVTNRVMQHKMPGSSYVAGSESGLTKKKVNIQKDFKGLDQNRIIWREDWDGKELKGVREEDGVFKPAQILAPSKFRGPDGKVVDLFATNKGGYIYLTDNGEGGLTLDESKFAPELLEQFTFRTPTSSHVSGSVVEIVGILPAESGDLMVVPKSFTIQKGLDYDVDKENAYQYNHILFKGKFEILAEEHREKGIEALRRNNKGTDKIEDGEYIESILGEDYEDYLEALEKGVDDVEARVASFNQKFNEKLLENNFVAAHIAVFKNSSREVQSTVNSALSMEIAGGQAKLIEGLKGNTEKLSFSLLSPNYQRDKMALGATGKMAIGVYSNYVTMQSMMNIHRNLSNDPIRLQDFDSETGEYYPIEITIGNSTSDGSFGEKNTLDGNRTRAKAFEERQNTATDNEKEQILARVGINKHTIGVDSLLTLLGFDQDENGNSIPYLFVSQPIVQEYAKLIDEGRGTLAKFDPDLEGTVYKTLMEKYEHSGETSNPRDWNGDALIAGIKGTDFRHQTAILDNFLELKDKAKFLASKQKVINMNNLGKSMIESADSLSKLENFENDRLKNFDELIRDHQGFTPQGVIADTGLRMAQNLWGGFFPYYNEDFKTLMNETEKYTEGQSDTKKLSFKEDTVKAFKMYSNSMKSNGLFTELSGKERDALFIDREATETEKGNTSLAKYIHNLIMYEEESGTNRQGIDKVQKNKFINKLSYEIAKDETPSLIKFNNTANDSFNEEYLFRGIIELLASKKPLPNKNGQPYNTRMLAQELINYSYLEGGVQEAIQFIKYVPIQYLDTVGTKNSTVAETMRKNLSAKNPNFGKLIGIRSTEDAYIPSIFMQQVIQHNPDMARQYPNETERKTLGIGGKSFTLNSPETSPYISYKKKGKAKSKNAQWMLYKHVGEGEYVQIDTLGTFGMNEYQYNATSATSLLTEVTPESTRLASVQTNTETFETVVAPFGIKEGASVQNVLDEIANMNNPENKELEVMKNLANLLTPFVDQTTKITVNPATSGIAKFTIDSNTIEFSSDRLKDAPGSARSFLHEYIHSITAREIRGFIKRNPVTKTYTVLEGAPESVNRIVANYNTYRNSLDATELSSFEKAYEAYANNRSVGMKKVDNAKVLYPAINIEEFITGMTTNNEAISYAKTLPTGFFEKVNKAFADFVAFLLPESVDKNIASDSIYSILAFVEEVKGKKVEPIKIPETKPKTPVITPSIPVVTTVIEIQKEIKEVKEETSKPEKTDIYSVALSKAKKLVGIPEKEIDTEPTTTEVPDFQLNMTDSIIDKLPKKDCE